MRTRQSPADLQAACDSFNANCQPGDRVTLLLDCGDTVYTTTTSRAEVMSDHSAVVWLSGVRGCYALDRVTIHAIKAQPGEKA